MSRLREIGERLVAAARPRFKDFRVDFEKISNAASKAAREGREGLAPADGLAFFNDGDWAIRMPLQQLYVDQGAHEAVAHYHATRFKRLLGRNTAWPDEPAWHALQLFAASGRGDIGVALARSYVDMQHKRLKRDYAMRKPRGSRVQRDEGVEKALAMTAKVIAGAIPDRKAELLNAVEAVAPYFDAYGGDEDRAWLEGVRREVWMEKRA